MRTFLFNPYTGRPRHPSDIASDPQGLLIVEPDAPLMAAQPPIYVVVCQNDKAHPRWGVDPGGPIVHEQYVKTATRENAMQRAAVMEVHGACRIARLVFDDQAPASPA